jgi:hypothetical protein
MIILLGLILLIAAIVFGVAGIVANVGAAHSIGNSFAIFGHHVSGSSGLLFLYGIVVGGVAVLGLAMLLANARHLHRRGHEARGGLKESRRQAKAAARERQKLSQQHEDAVTRMADARVEAAQANTRADSVTRERDDIADQNQAISTRTDDARLEAANARAKAAEERAEAVARERNHLAEQHQDALVKIADSRVEAANSRANAAEAKAEALAHERDHLADRHRASTTQNADAPAAKVENPPAPAARVGNPPAPAADERQTGQKPPEEARGHRRVTDRWRHLAGHSS